MADINVQLFNPENSEERWFPITLAGLVMMPSGSTLLEELAHYLKQKEHSTTDAPYVQEVTVNETGTQLQVKTWSKDANGVLASQSIDIVGANTTYNLTASYNTAGDGQIANTKLILSGSDGVTSSINVPVGALVDDTNVELILDGRFS